MDVLGACGRAVVSCACAACACLLLDGPSPRHSASATPSRTISVQSYPQVPAVLPTATRSTSRVFSRATKRHDTQTQSPNAPQAPLALCPARHSRVSRRHLSPPPLRPTSAPRLKWESSPTPRCWSQTGATTTSTQTTARGLGRAPTPRRRCSRTMTRGDRRSPTATQRWRQGRRRQSQSSGLRAHGAAERAPHRVRRRSTHRGHHRKETPTHEEASCASAPATQRAPRARGGPTTRGRARASAPPSRHAQALLPPTTAPPHAATYQ